MQWKIQLNGCTYVYISCKWKIILKGLCIMFYKSFSGGIGLLHGSCILWHDLLKTIVS